MADETLEAFGYSDRDKRFLDEGLSPSLSRVEMEEANRQAADQMLPLPYDLPAEEKPLLERSREDFLAALPELEQSGVDTDFLRREYARVNSLTGGLNTEPEEGRKSVAGSMGFLSKPEGSTGRDAVRGLRVEPRVGATQIAQEVEMALSAPARAAQGLMPEEDMGLEAFGTAGLVGAGGVARAGRGAGRVDEETVNIFGGQRATDPGYNITYNELPESVGFDGKYRFEIPDNEIVLVTNNIPKIGDTTELANAVIHDELFYQYPQIANYRIGYTDDQNLKGSFDPNTKSILLHRGNTPDQNRKTLVHELQHAVQDIEGFAPGANQVIGAMNKERAIPFVESARREVEQQVLEAKPELFLDSIKGVRQAVEEFLPDGSFNRDFNLTQLERESRILLEGMSPLRNAESKLKALRSSAVRTQIALEDIASQIARDTEIGDPLPNLESLGPYRGPVTELILAMQDNKFDSGDIRKASDRTSRIGYDARKKIMDTFLGDLPGYIPKDTPTLMELAHLSYRITSGEVEARNAPNRMDFTEEQRFQVTPEETEDTPRAFQWVRERDSFNKGGLVADSNTMSDYFKASSGVMSEMDFVGKHKMSTAEFERKFEEENNVDLSGAESLTDIKGSTPMGKQRKGYAEGGTVLGELKENKQADGRRGQSYREYLSEEGFGNWENDPIWRGDGSRVFRENNSALPWSKEGFNNEEASPRLLQSLLPMLLALEDRESNGSITDFERGMLKNLREVVTSRTGMYKGGVVRTDPISGNEVPTGSLPEEVRDDVPAMLSEGEYVIPADVVRYFGVNFFEQLREKAKQGLDTMQADGRTGEPEIHPDDMQSITQMAQGGVVDPNNLEGIIDRVLETVKTNPNLQNVFQKKGIMMAEGGLVDPPTQGSFNPSDWTAVGTGGPPKTAGGYDYREYVGPTGQSQMILFVNGVPATTIPSGFVLAGQQQASQESRSTRDRDRQTGMVPRGESTGPGDGMLAGFGNPLGELDFQSPEDVMTWAEDRLKTNSASGTLARGAMAAGPAGLLGLGAMKGMEARRIAEVRAAALAAKNEGNLELADSLRKSAQDAQDNFGIAGKAIPEEWMDGDRIYENYLERSGREKPTPRTVTQTEQALTPTRGGRDRDRDLPTRSTSGGVEYKSDATEDGSYSRAVATGSTAPTTSTRPTARPTTPAPKTESYEQKISRGGGFNRGGLVTRPTKTK